MTVISSIRFITGHGKSTINVDLEFIWDDAYPDLKERCDNMDENQERKFAYYYAPDAADYIVETARQRFTEGKLWGKRVSADNVDEYNSAIGDICWSIADRIIDELIKYLGLKPDRTVTHGEAVA